MLPVSILANVKCLEKNTFIIYISIWFDVFLIVTLHTIWFLFRSDLEEVRKQIGLDGNISEILDQFGASSSGKISYEQFCENSAVLFGDQAVSCGSDSSPEYCSTDSASEVIVHVPMATTEKGRTKKDDNRKGVWRWYNVCLIKQY